MRKQIFKMVVATTVGLTLLSMFGIGARSVTTDEEIEVEIEITPTEENIELFMPFGPECGGIVVGGGGSGTALNGWFNINGARYFFVNGVRRTGWFQQGSAWFFLNPPAGTSGHNPNHTIGRMQTGWVRHVSL